jgi:ribonuclease E
MSEPPVTDRHDSAQPEKADNQSQADQPPKATRKPQIGDSRPAPPSSNGDDDDDASSSNDRSSGDGQSQDQDRDQNKGQRQSQNKGQRQGQKQDQKQGQRQGQKQDQKQGQKQGQSKGQQQQGRNRQQQNRKGGGDQQQSEGGGSSGGRRRRRGGRRRGGQRQQQPVEAVTTDAPVELDEETLAQRRGDSRKGRPVGRYSMVVHVQDDTTHIAILEGRALIEYYVSRPADDVTEIHGNIYLGRVQNVLPGMEAAFIDIGTPKNAVLYHGDVQYDRDDFEGSGPPRIEQVLKARQTILCQVTKNPIAHKGARLTQEVSLPGRFVVLVPNSTTYGISKRLPDKERKRLRNILDKAKPAEHGVIVRTAAESVTAEEIERDVKRLLSQWDQIETLAAKAKAASLLYREPDMALRVIREEFTKDYRSVVIDDPDLFGSVNDYVSSITPALADRVEMYDIDQEKLSLFERFHVHEQLHKALDTNVWLPSGGSLVIEHTEALTVIDVNTGKNVGSSSLEDTVFDNNLEAAREVPRQLRLRDIGGIIVIDFVDMESRRNRDAVIKAFREALAQDKTRTQVFDISELGLVEMTRKRIGEGLLESFSNACPVCEGRGLEFEDDLLAEV